MKFHCPSKGPADRLTCFSKAWKHSEGLQRGVEESMNMNAKVFEIISR